MRLERRRGRFPARSIPMLFVDMPFVAIPGVILIAALLKPTRSVHHDSRLFKVLSPAPAFLGIETCFVPGIVRRIAAKHNPVMQTEGPRSPEFDFGRNDAKT